MIYGVRQTNLNNNNATGNLNIFVDFFKGKGNSYFHY